MAVSVCSRCGMQHDGTSVFCPACGAVQTPPAQAPQQDQPPYGQQYGQPQHYGQPTQYGQPPPALPPPGGWTSQAASTGSWEPPPQYATAPVGPPPQSPRDPKFLILVLGIVGIVVVAGVIAFLLLSRHGSTSPSASSATSSSAAPSTRSAPSSSATASRTGGVRSVVGTPETAPLSTSGTQVSLAAAGADCTYPPSVDGNNQPVTYEPQKAVDGDPTTAWRCPGAGGHTIELHGVGQVTDLGVIPGYAKVDPATGVNRFTDNHTVTQVVWRLRQGPNTFQIVEDIPNPTPQIAWVHLPGSYGFDSITLTVTGTGNPGARQDSTPISTIAVWGSAGSG